MKKEFTIQEVEKNYYFDRYFKESNLSYTNNKITVKEIIDSNLRISTKYWIIINYCEPTNEELQDLILKMCKINLILLKTKKANIMASSFKFKKLLIGLENFKKGETNKECLKKLVETFNFKGYSLFTVNEYNVELGFIFLLEIYIGYKKNEFNWLNTCVNHLSSSHVYPNYKKCKNKKEYFKKLYSLLNDFIK